jgi:predicted glutamine amidotransferase
MSSGRISSRATFWLVDAPDSLDVQSAANPDGTGIGVYDASGRPTVLKQPLAADHDLDFAREARDLESTTFVAHVRHASQGGISLRNTHPFTMDDRIFAHNGGLGDLPALEAQLGDDLALVQGETDSERLFALVSREIRTAGGDVAAGLTTAITWVIEHLPVYALNVILTTDDGLWAVRYPETHSLYLLTAGAGDAEHRSEEGLRVSGRDLPPRVVVASERLDDDPGWTALAPGELLVIHPDLRVERTVLWDRPPPRRLAD